jgi:hypothetical protein
MNAIFRKAYSVVGALLMVLLVVQFFLAGAGVFTIINGATDSGVTGKVIAQSLPFWMAHVLNGAAIGIAIILLIAFSFGARHPWRVTGLTSLLFVLMVLQSFLAHTGPGYIAALHVVNGLVITGLTGALVGRTWAFRRAARYAPEVTQQERPEAVPEAAGTVR